MDLSKLSNTDLDALLAGDVTKLSNEGLDILTAKEKMGFWEGVGQDYKSAGHLVKDAWDLGAGALAKAFGDEKGSDAIFKDMQERRKAHQKELEAKDRSFANRVGGAVLSFPAQIAAMPFSPADTGVSLVDNGESIGKAQTGALVDTAGNMAGLALPGGFGKTLGQRVLTGGASNAAQDYLTKSVIRDIADTDASKQQFTPTVEGTALAGIVGMGGGVMHHLHEKAPTVSVEDKSKYNGAPKPEEEPTYSGVTDARNRIATLTSQEKAIREHMERQGDMSSDYYMKMKDDLNNIQYQRNKLEEALAKHDGTTSDLQDAIKQAMDEDKVQPTEQDRVTAETKLASIEEEYNNLAKKGAALTADEKLRLQELQDEHSRVSDFLEHNAAKFYGEDASETPLNRSQTDFHQLAEGYMPSWVLGHGMREAFDATGLRGGIEYIAKMKDHPDLTSYGKYLGHLAEKLLSNPLFGKDGMFYDPTLEFSGGYNNATGQIVFKDRISASPAVALHEAVHSVVNKALALFDEGKLVEPRQVNAARNIKDLWRKIKNTPELFAKIEKTVGEDNAKIIFENTREFVAYGMSDQQFQLALNKIKLGEQSVWSRLTNAIKNLMNLNKNERTALDDVLRYGETLIDMSDGGPLGYRPKEGSLYSAMAKRNTPQALLADIRSGSLKVFGHLFTQNLRQMMRDNPHFSKLEKSIAEADRRREFISRKALFGLDSYKDWMNKGKYFFSLAGAEKSDALVPILQKIPDSDNHLIAETMDVAMDGYRNGVSIDDTIAKQVGWQDWQKNLLKAVDKAVETLFEGAVKMQASNELKAKLKQRIGYVLTTRRGNHGVTVSVNGVTVRYQTYATKAEAEYRAKWFKDQGGDLVSVEYKKVDEKLGESATDNLVKFIESMAGMSDKDVLKKIDETYDALTTDNASIGKHSKTSGIIAGFMGDQAELNKHDRGRMWRDALPAAVNEYAQNIMSREVHKNLIDWHIDNDHKMDKTTADLGDFYAKTQVGRPYTEGTARDYLRKHSEAFKEAIDTVVDRVFGFSNRDKHAFDRFMGLFGNAFYIANITMKPAQWLAQPLQALTSARSAFKEGASARDAMLALGDTVKMMVTQKYGSSKDFMESLYHVSQEGNTLHPQMTNEFNDMKIGNDPNTVLNKTFDMLTGRTISAAGDKASRLFSYTYFYNLHKRAGYSGKELWNMAARDATENMVAYGNKKMPAIYKEMGLFGEQSAPLATFAHTQLGNMIVDVKEFVKSPSARTSAPLVMTMGLMMIMGGAISMPILAEYELLRQAGKASGLWGNEWPSASDAVLKHTPEWVSRGVISAATGIDLDASMRYTSLLKNIMDVENASVLAFMPQLAWAKDVATNVPTIVSGMVGGNTTHGEVDMAIKKVVPKGWMAGAVDTLRHGGDTYTHMGKDASAGVERGTAEAVAPWLGSRSTREANDMMAIRTNSERNKEETKLLSRAAQFYIDGDGKHTEKIINHLLEDYYNGDREKLNTAINNEVNKGTLPAVFRQYMNSSGTMTEDQRRHWLRDDMSSYMEKRNK